MPVNNTLTFSNQYATQVFEQNTSLKILQRAINKELFPSRIALISKPLEEIFAYIPSALFKKIKLVFLHIFEICQYTHEKVKGQISGKDYFKVVFGKFTHIVLFDPLSILFLTVEKTIKIAALVIGIIVSPKACAYMMKAPTCIKLAEVYLNDKFWKLLAPKHKVQEQETIIKFSNLTSFLGEDVINKLSPAKDNKKEIDKEYVKFREDLANYYEKLDNFFSNNHRYPLWVKLEKSAIVKKAFDSYTHPRKDECLHDFTPTYINAIKTSTDLNAEMLITIFHLMLPINHSLYRWVEENGDQTKIIEMNEIMDNKLDVENQKKVILGGIRVKESRI